ncbi:hypothetical protein AQUCO_00400555v1 [Aquilegia coerulea]|uniref:Protein kinase domain-containing protein n=1 Tax=Aquilegia coerulea TaxID=218851 RepID=A0A2G5EVF6_AQUCA|nr:hypothetical protein AQUCO_00400555v1 [Aquilegia coerulea]
MGFNSSSSMESVIVVMDANRNKGNVDALDWALNRVVRPKDTVIVLGIICEFGKKTSCFPFYMGIGISAIWERLEFSGQGEMTPKVVEEEIAKKREQYQCTLQPFYRQCKKNEVKLEVKLAAGFDPKKITIEEARNSNTRWIVLDSHLKKHKAFIYEHTGCNVAAMKEKDLATIKMSEVTDYEASNKKEADLMESSHSAVGQEETQNDNLSKRAKLSASPSPSPCWYPPSWRTGFPRNFTQIEIESITNGFALENLILNEDNLQLYKGILMDSPVLVKCFFGDDEPFWSELQILSRVRHCNFSNLVGFCSTENSMILLRDYTNDGSLGMHLQCDELAKNLTWKLRFNIAKGIGSCLRYLQEDCIDGLIMDLSVSSSDILISRGRSVMLTELASKKCLKDWQASGGGLLVENSFECQAEADQDRYVDVHAFGLFLLELLTGRKAFGLVDCGENQSLVDWAFPHLEKGFLNEVIDPRLIDSVDAKEVHCMAHAALLCLKRDYVNPPSISEALSLFQD